MREATRPDPATSSFYVNPAFYETLLADFSGFDLDEREVTDPAARDRYRRLLEREARLLDGHRLEDWLALFSPECLYWAPATPGGGDPRREVAVFLDDRRRMEDRVHRLRSRFAWSQAPASRTVRLISNVEVFETARPGVRMVRSNFLISEMRADETRHLTGWCAHRVSDRGAQLAIEVKQVNLIDCDRNLRNPSFLL
jgi:3-phenylpropionate/cinnamic acid dioxygenase small subunit